MRRLLWVAVAAGLAGTAAVSGCGAPQASGPAAGTPTASPSVTALPSASRTPAGATAGTKDGTKAGAAELLARAEAAMGAEAGWTFTVTGKESLTQSGAPEGQGSKASYSARVDRTAGPEALHQAGTVTGKNGSRPEEVVTVGGTGYVREGAPGTPWTTGPLTDPEIAAKVEDPLDVLASFADHAERGERIEVVRSGGEIRLRMRVPSATLAEREERPAVARAAREFLPTLKQLRKAGVTASEKKIVLTGLEESLVLDARTHRMTSYRSSFGFAVPHEGRQLRYAQTLGADTRGIFTGRIEAPVTAR
ncbi:hypothetical protein [Streptomyces sp. NPDC015130]|uniref:hypothetical protein n=1 Tax=Streptomyces sp. NPDC015130 TaxID=3364940 RepID=UPI0036FAC470